MSEIQLTAKDGHVFAVHVAKPAEASAGAVVVAHEILGVSPYIRRVCQRFAAAGYVAFAPALFDRWERDVSLNVEAADVARGRALRDQAGYDLPMLDLAATIGEAGKYGRVAVVGFCWGGTLAWRAAGLPGVSAVVSYYGGQIVDYLNEVPRAPVLLQFGETDPVISADARTRIHEAFPDIRQNVYPAGHAFDNDMRDDHDPDSSRRAHIETLTFISRELSK